MQAVFEADDYDNAWDKLESKSDIDLNVRDVGDVDFDIEEVKDAEV
jgi:hypothetical protein